MARRLAEGVVTAPMVFLGMGLVATLFVDAPEMQQLQDLLHPLAEITLVIVLFTDAAMMRLKRGDRAGVTRAGRMLVLGLPLMILIGYLIARPLLPDWPLWEVALLAAILAPTDAALGQAVISNTAVPERIRTAITMESGLNDGLALPAILLFGCLAVAGLHDNVQTSWVVFAMEQVGLGVLTGALVGAGGGWFIKKASSTGYSNDLYEGIGVLALAGLAYLLSAELGGNGFLATFVAGLAFGMVLGERHPFLLEFMETEGQMLVLLAFLTIGLTFSMDRLMAVDPVWIGLIVTSLFVARPLAIWLSLTGSGAEPGEKLFMGWFGPRGLATALFALLVLHDFDGLTHGDEILLIAFTAVLISAVLHGVSAAPAARWIGRVSGLQKDV
ncbi:sodium:proton antiporter [Rhodophyticola sp. CCM32]|nr:sodium:proton antiporter [Rhodophyticola sp. CCM32]